jgi:hypothetical protein
MKKTMVSSETVDYSQKNSWCQIPDITKDVDTFYIYATEYNVTSFEDGAADYATLDNAEMLQGVPVEVTGHASAFADSTNVFVPYYRQAGLRFAGEINKKTGDVNAALYGMPYDDITTARRGSRDCCLLLRSGRPPRLRLHILLQQYQGQRGKAYRGVSKYK